MNPRYLRIAAIAFALILLTGCEGIVGKSGPGVVVIDLGEIARATGQDKLMQERARDRREELTAELTGTATRLEQQLTEQRDALGDAPSEEAQQELQEAANRAQQQYQLAQQRLQQQAQDYENNMVVALRAAIEPIAEVAARKRGAGVILLADVTTFWTDPKADITDEVLTAIDADPSILAALDDDGGAGAGSAAPGAAN